MASTVFRDFLGVSSAKAATQSACTNEYRSTVCPTLAPLPPQNHANLDSTTAQNEAHHSGNLLLQEQEYEELQDIKEEDEEEEEEEPIFVLTDEWREFFAKSEAKRKLEKKQAKKKQKN
ncbi:hypothetical protein V6N12_053869 [Hibiscus sabdariffa]|uniref:Uncharacterized protein n=1 Tax=Hibiscus sabdariffa TaxID=183260 RepID=A0ABR2D8U3_9ROSI